MSDFQLLQERIIQRRGLINIPESWSRYSPLLLVADVVVLPLNYSVNFKYQPSKGRWSNINFIQSGRVTFSFTQEYVYQQFQAHEYGLTQNHELMNCIEQNILNNQVALGASQNPPVPLNQITSIIAGGGSFPLFGETDIFIATEADSRIRYRLYQFPSYQCVLNSIPKFSFPAPDLPQTLTSDNPQKDDIYPVSQPYVPPDDNGLTYVPPLPPPPQPVSNCTISYDYVDLRSPSFNGTYQKTITNVIPPLTLGNVQYSNFNGSPNNTPLRSDVPVTTGDGQNILFNLSQNRSNGHRIDAVSVLSCTPV